MPDRDATVPLAELLESYVPTAAERDDLRRIQRLVAAGSPWDRGQPLHVTASALIVHPPSSRVLLRWHERQQAWLQIGGHADPGEDDPLAVARREGQEETGLPDLVPWPDATLRHVVVVPVPANDREPAHEHADLRFVLATAVPEAARPERPTALLRWLPIDDAVQLTSEDNVRETIRRVKRAFRRASRG
jgi:8-oxo-dGTP pyrophosphatase MutT (NUDIX family)